MSNEDTRELLKRQLLSSIPGSKLVAGGREVMCRCHICMDSPDTRKSHMYISLGDQNTPPLYHCFLCDSGGIVDGKFLRSREIYDPNLISLLNSEKAKRPISQTLSRTDKANIRYDCNKDYCEWNYAKLDYLFHRIGHHFSFDELNKMRIILNINDLLAFNGIKERTRFPQDMENFNNNYIGFLSTNNCFVNMRKFVLDAPGRRYENYNIFGRYDNIGRYYILPAKIEVNNPNPVEVHIAEGAFDILSVYYNVTNQKSDHSVYMSIGGKSYLAAIKYLIEDVGLMNMVINIYIDNDIDRRYIKQLVNYLSPFNIKFNVYANEFDGEKDFGVPKDRIKVVKVI